MPFHPEAVRPLLTTPPTCPLRPLVAASAPNASSRRLLPRPQVASRPLQAVLASHSLSDLDTGSLCFEMLSSFGSRDPVRSCSLSCVFNSCSWLLFLALSLSSRFPLSLFLSAFLTKDSLWPCHSLQRPHCPPVAGGPVKVQVTQSCPTLRDRMDHTVHGILQARILEWAAFPFNNGSSRPRNQTGVFCVAGQFFTNWAVREARRGHWNQWHN